MKLVFSFFALLITLSGFPQNEQASKYGKGEDDAALLETPKATYKQYRIISIERDTTYVDTSLTIKKEYEYNYLRKDNFGLMPFANEGQTYTTLQYGLNRLSPFPEFGYAAKHFNYFKSNQIKYYSVATPLTELYFKTVMEQGQSIESFFTINTSPRLNFSISYKGLRSLGKYINQLSSTGNFTFTTSYNTKNNRYFLKAHFLSQDILNQENGGITTPEDFESNNSAYNNRPRLNVYFKDAKSFLRGKTVFIDHHYQINPKKGANNLYLTHQMNYESKFFEFNQPTIPTSVTSSTGTPETFNRFGDAYVTGNINNQVRYNKMYNKIGAQYENTVLGKFQFFIDDFRSNYYYNSVLFLSNVTIPNALNLKINSVGGQYEYLKNNWTGTFLYSNSISNQSMVNFDAKFKYKINETNSLAFEYQKVNKLPDNIYNLHQSSYVNYNWSNNFKNEKINNLNVNLNTNWINAALQITNLDDHLYFSNDDATKFQLVSPKQYGKTINYLSIKANREFKFRKFALDNTVLYQKVDQKDNILNVPQFVVRNSLYYTNYYFKKAMYLQTGVIFNYFTKYSASEYNPILGEFFVQNQKEIGAFPNLDFFINARIQRTRIYLKAEHFNASMSGNNFYSAPNYPYRDFIIRFGLVWNFFQ
jgi:hypothetical protein